MKSLTSSQASLKSLLAAVIMAGLASSAHAVVVAWTPQAQTKTPASTVAAAVQAAGNASSTNTFQELQYQSAAPAAGSEFAMAAQVAPVAPAPVAVTTALQPDPVTGLGFQSELAGAEMESFQAVSFATAEGAVTNGGGSNDHYTPIPEMNVLFPIVGLLVAISSTQILRRRREAQIGDLKD